jgi:hypothetical protein
MVLESKRRNGGGALRSASRLFMLVMTSVMFGLGFVAIALKTSLEYQQFTRLLNLSGSSSWSIHRINVVTAVGATTVCIIVGQHLLAVWR